MRIAFESSHVRGDYSSGLLTIGIAAEDETVMQTIWDDVSFEVPADFHTHNDSVAAALLTLAGDRFSEVEFNFPISPFCAETLRASYGLHAIGPVDPALEPRQRGTRTGLLFSGGVHSTAAWIVLHRALGDDLVVITSEYGGRFDVEAQGYRGYRRDISCRTDIRQKQWDRNGRFNFCVPLLFADYLDLAAIAAGHTIAHPNTNLGSLRHGGPEQWTHGAQALQAGGLDELHIVRSLTTLGIAKLFMAFGPERIEAALAGSAPPGELTRYTTELIFRLLHEEAGLPIPDIVLRSPFPHEPVRFGEQAELDHCILYLIRRGDLDEATRLCPNLRHIDIAPLRKMALNFLHRYCTNLTELLPLPLRIHVMDTFHEADVYPYDERDWYEVGLVMDFFKELASAPQPA